MIETLRPPVPIPAAVRDSAIDAVRERLRERGGANQDWSRVPEAWPAVQQIFPTRESGVWVETASPDSLRRFDVYDGTGAYSGTKCLTFTKKLWPNLPQVCLEPLTKYTLTAMMKVLGHKIVV